MTPGTRSSALVACLFLVGCEGGGTAPPSGSAGAPMPPVPAGSQGDAPAPGPSFRFSVGPVYRAAHEASSGENARIEAFFDGVLAPLRALPGLLPETVSVVYDECGAASASFDATTSTIILCHELSLAADELFGAGGSWMPGADAPAQLLSRSAMGFMLYHEIGHAMEHQLGLPLAGNIESAMDAIATVVAIESDRFVYAAAGALLFDRPPASLAARHGGGPDRGGDIACWTVGGDARAAASDVEIEDAFALAGRDCVGEYVGERDAVRGWVPGLGRLQGVAGASGPGATGPFELRFGPRWQESAGQDPSARRELEDAFSRALVPLNESIGALAAPVSVVYDRCGAARSSWDGPTRTIEVCDELLARVYELQIGDTAQSSVSDAAFELQFTYDFLSYDVYHEAGHFLHETGAIPEGLDVESAADAVAAVLLVEAGRWMSVLVAADFLFDQPADHEAVHGPAGRRPEDLGCWMIGGDAAARAVPQLEQLVLYYTERGRDCVAEYAALRDSVRGWLGAAAGR